MQGGGEGFRGVSHSPVEGECVIMAVGIDERQHLIAKVKVEVAEVEAPAVEETPAEEVAE